MKKITVLLFVMISIIKPQTINKVVQFTDSESIDIVTESENYVGAAISVNSFQALPRAILFNKNGDIVFEIKDPERSEFIVAEPVESLGYFITVRRGGGKVLDQIRAFDLNTGQKVWETEANACAYELSPNKKFMITVGDPGTERAGNFEIINLKDGSKVDFDYEYSRYCAAWLDNERIIFVFQEWEKSKVIYTPEYTAEEYKNDRMKIESESFQIENLLKKELMTQGDYDKRKKELEERRAEIEKKAPKVTITNSGRRFRPGVITQAVPKTIRLAIYNMTTKSFDREEYLYKGDGSKISIGIDAGGSNTINVDKEKNIYIYGHEYIENDIFYYLVKFSKNLDFIWTTKKNIGGIISYFVDDDIYFRSYWGGNVNLIDNDTGDLVPVDEVKKSNPKIQDIDFSYDYRIEKVKIIKNVNIDYRGKTITFLKEED